MVLIYMIDTDTLEVVYRDRSGPVAETVDGPKEWLTMDFDEEGRLVSQTIEHASEHAPETWSKAIERAVHVIVYKSTVDWGQVQALYLTAEGNLDLEATFEANEIWTVEDRRRFTEERRRRLTGEDD